MQEHIVTGRIVRLAIFSVPEFGIRASFTIDDTGRLPVVCAVEGDVAREFIGLYSEGDKVIVKGIYEPRPSTAAANCPWLLAFGYATCASRKTPVSRHEAVADPRDERVLQTRATVSQRPRSQRSAATSRRTGRNAPFGVHWMSRRMITASASNQHRSNDREASVKVLSLTSAHNSLSQRLLVEPTARGHDIHVCVAATGETMIAAVFDEVPDLIIAPMLKIAIPEQVWSRNICVIVHPGSGIVDRRQCHIEKLINLYGFRVQRLLARKGSKCRQTQFLDQPAFQLCTRGDISTLRGQLGNFAQSALARYRNWPVPTIIKRPLRQIVVTSAKTRNRACSRLKKGASDAIRGTDISSLGNLEDGINHLTLDSCHR
jgi:hypothetical protein